MLDKRIKNLLGSILDELLYCRDAHSDSKNYRGHTIFSIEGILREPVHYTLINEICDILVENEKEKDLANV